MFCRAFTSIVISTSEFPIRGLLLLLLLFFRFLLWTWIILLTLLFFRVEVNSGFALFTVCLFVTAFWPLWRHGRAFRCLQLSFWRWLLIDMFLTTFLFLWNHNFRNLDDALNLCVIQESVCLWRPGIFELNIIIYPLFYIWSMDLGESRL